MGWWNRSSRREGAVERRILERQVGRVALVIVDKLRETDLGGEQRSDAAVLLGEVDAGDTAAELLCQTSRCPADTATDIQHPLRRIEAGGARKLERRRPAADVEFVDRRQVLEREAICVASRLFQRREDDVPQIGTGVVRLDGFVDSSRHGHDHSAYWCLTRRRGTDRDTTAAVDGQGECDVPAWQASDVWQGHPPEEPLTI